MDPSRNIEHLERVIRSDKGEVRLRLGGGVIIVIAGILAALNMDSLSVVSSLQDLTWIRQLAGPLMSSLATFPLVPILKIRRRITACRYLIAEYQALGDSADSINQQHLSKIEELFYSVVSKDL